MINAIGLENPGIDAWIGRLPEWATLRQPVIVSVGGNEPEQYAAVVAALEAHLAGAPAGTAPRIEGYELNVSCPNVSSGLQIGADPSATAEVVAACREATDRFLLAKLTPNVRDVAEAGAAALGAGADGLSLVNTFKALVLDPQTLKPFLGNRTGGLCGPAIKPIALRMVAEVAQAFPDTPIVGMGGVMTGLDALEFIACGATAVAVGAANFTAFEAPQRILAELRASSRHGFSSVTRPGRRLSTCASAREYLELARLTRYIDAVRLTDGHPQCDPERGRPVPSRVDAPTCPSRPSYRTLLPISSSGFIAPPPSAYPLARGKRLAGDAIASHRAVSYLFRSGTTGKKRGDGGTS